MKPPYLKGSSTRGLVYTWVAYKNNVQDFTIPSVSIQFNSYKLKANTLAVGNVYSFTLTVLDTVTLKSSVATVTVTVIPSLLVAVITGSTRRSILLGSSETIDASNSYNQDTLGQCHSDCLRLRYYLRYTSPKLNFFLISRFSRKFNKFIIYLVL